MILLIVIFGLFLIATGMLIVANPQLVFAFLQENHDKPVLHLIAIVVRLILGVALVLQSDQSKFPVPIEILGWLLIVAALALVLMGRQRFTRLVSWMLTAFSPFARVGGAMGLMLGAFLVYAFI